MKEMFIQAYPLKMRLYGILCLFLQFSAITSHVKSLNEPFEDQMQGRRFVFNIYNDDCI